MVEVTVSCDVCGDTMLSVDASDRLRVVRGDDWQECPLATPRYVLSMDATNMLAGISGWATYMYDGGEHLLCSDCVEELHERVSQFEDEKDRVIKEFFGDE